MPELTVDELNVVITAQTQDFNKKINEVNQKINKITAGVNQRVNSAAASIEKSGNRISGTFSKIGSVVSAALAVKALSGFAKQALEMASGLQEVQNVVDVSFGDMAYKAEAFADTAIESFGLSELAAKKTSSTYMAMAKGIGIADDVASDMAISLTQLSADVASFYNISQELADIKLRSVFTGETETLKDLGVVMTQANLQQFAYSQGIQKTIDKMTQAERVILQYKFVTQQLSLAQGDFTRTSGSWANQVRVLSERWKEFMSIVGNGLIQVLNPLLQAINSLLSKLILLGKSIGQAMSSLFGITTSTSNQSDGMQAIVEDTYDAADAQGDLANQTEEAGKAAKKASMSFDELNILSNPSSSTSSGVSGSGSGAGTSIDTSVDQGSVEQTEGALSGLAKKIRELLAPLSVINFDPLTQSLDRLKKAMLPLTQSIFSGLEWAWYHLFVPMAEWTIEDVLPRYLDTLAKAARGAGAVLEGFQQVFKTFYDVFLKPIAEFAGEKFIQYLDNMNEDIESFVQLIEESDLFNDISSILEKIGPYLEKIMELLINIGSFISGAMWSSVINNLKDAFRNLEDVIGAVAAVLNGDFSDAWQHLYDLFIGNKLQKASDMFDGIKRSVLDFFGMTSDAVEEVDIFGDSISDTTQQKVKPFLDMVRDFDDVITSIDYQSLVIDQSIVDDAGQKVKKISDTIISELDADKNSALANLEPLRDALGEAAYNKLIGQNIDYYDNLKKQVQDGEARINEIMQTASNEHRTLTQEENEEITRIRDQMNEAGVKHLSESEIEYTTIMNRLKDNSERISLEQGSSIIQQAMTTRDEAINAAEEQYSAVMLQAQRMLEVGTINQEEYDAIVQAAGQTRDETVQAAQTQYQNIYDTTTSKLGETSKYIDSETGGIKSKWDVFCDGITGAWDKLWANVRLAWRNFSDALGYHWSQFWAGIGNFFIDIWNGVGSGLELALNGIIDVLNRFRVTLPDLWIFGDLAGKSIGFNIGHVKFPWVSRIPTTTYTPPALAKGGVAYQETLAMIGEGKDREAVLPLNSQVYREIASGINSERGGQDNRILDRLARIEQAIKDYSGGDIYLDREKIGEKMDRRSAAKSRRYGQPVNA